MDVVRYLAGLGADMETPIHDGATPAFIACYRGMWRSCGFLCSQMVNLEADSERGTRPLPSLHNIEGWISRRFCCSTVSILHQSKRKGARPSFFACQEENLDVVKFLVRNGADARLGKNGISPFHMACYRGHLDVVTYLVVEVEVDARGRQVGRTLEVARHAKKADVAGFLERI